MQQKLRQVFQSIRIANTVLFLVVLCAIFGTLPPDLNFLSFSPRSVFRSPWFCLLLGYLAVSMLWLAFRRIAGILSRYHDDAGLFSNRESLPFIQEVVLPAGRCGRLDSFGDAVLQVIKAYGYRAFAQNKSESEYSFYAAKNSLGCWGSPLVHFGFVMVLAGGLLTFLFSDVRDLSIREGETVDIVYAQAKVKLEKFSVVLYPSRLEPEQYVSRLLIRDKEGRVWREDLKVNHPLMIGGTKFFQMRYQIEIPGLELVAYRQGLPVEAVPLKLGERKPFEQVPIAVEVKEVLPDFAISKAGKAESRSPYFRNPAVLVSVYDPPQSAVAAKKVWVFPDLVSHDSQESDELQFTFRKLKKRYSSGIKLSRDPGVLFAYSGFLFLILGAFISGFIIPRALTGCLRLHPDQGKFMIEILGHPAKDRYGFERELKALGNAMTRIKLEAAS